MISRFSNLTILTLLPFIPIYVEGSNGDKDLMPYIQTCDMAFIIRQGDTSVVQLHDSGEIKWTGPARERCIELQNRGTSMVVFFGGGIDNGVTPPLPWRWEIFVEFLDDEKINISTLSGRNTGKYITIDELRKIFSTRNKIPSNVNND